MTKSDDWFFKVPARYLPLLVALWIVLLIATSGRAAAAPSLKLLTLNLHGYHPMGASERFLQNRRNGPTAQQTPPYKADTQMTYFTWNELTEGNARRIQALGRDLSGRAADIILFQEVGAGGPASPRNCEVFYSQTEPQDQLNVALRLQAELASRSMPMRAALACRGNTGWTTDANSFSDRRVVVLENQRFRVIHDFNSNPYPRGIITEGLAVLTSPRVEVLENLAITLPINFRGETFFAQVVSFRDRAEGPSSWKIIANIHGGHKVQHFEQAVALQRWLIGYIRDRSYLGKFSGLVVAGDFNARLFRSVLRNGGSRLASLSLSMESDDPDVGDVSTVAWEPRVPGLYDLTRYASQLAQVYSALINLNDSSQKPFATIRDSRERDRRVGDVLTRFDRWLSLAPQEILETSERMDAWVRSGNCRPAVEKQEGCEVSDRIDHIFASKSFETLRAQVLYPQNNWTRLDTLSDHPGVWVDFKANQFVP